MVVLDTNVLSEPFKPRPNPAVMRWFDSVEKTRTYTTAICIAELWEGVCNLDHGRKRAELHELVEGHFVAGFRDRTLDFDLNAAAEFGMVVEARRKAGRPVNAPDAMIASICRAHRMPLATGNIKDFEGTGIPLINPWEF